MEATAVVGELVYVSTDQGRAVVEYGTDGEQLHFKLDERTNNTRWKDLIGQTVKVIAIDGVVKEIGLATEE